MKSRLRRPGDHRQMTRRMKKAEAMMRKMTKMRTKTKRTKMTRTT